MNRKYFFLHFEWLVFLSGLLLMAFMDPFNTNPSFCLLDNLGAPFCPGEGLGRSIALAFRADITASFAMHPAGIPAVFIIGYRIISILKRNQKIESSDLTQSEK